MDSRRHHTALLPMEAKISVMKEMVRLLHKRVCMDSCQALCSDHTGDQEHKAPAESQLRRG